MQIKPLYSSAISAAAAFCKRWKPLLLIACAGLILLLYMHWQVSSSFTSIPIAFNALNASVFDTAVILLLFSLIPFRSCRFSWIPILLTAIYVFGNILFHRYLFGYMPNNAWLEVSNLFGLSDSILHGFRWPDAIILLISTALAIAASLHHGSYPPLRQRIIYLSSFIALIISAYLIRPFVLNYSPKEWFKENLGYGQYYWNKQYYICNHGVVLTAVRDIISSNNSTLQLTPEDKSLIEKTIKRPPFSFNIVRPDLILLIITESLIDQPLGDTIDGIEVTPTLNRLANNGVYAKIPLNLTSHGSSSDGQFMFFTGLLPKREGITIIDQSDRSLPGLGTTALNAGFSTILVNPANPTFWRQNLACDKYGIQRQLSYNDCSLPDRQPNAWLNDEQTFHLASQALDQNKNRPLFLTILTSSMHLPYYGDFPLAINHFTSIDDPCYRTYLQKINYTDLHLGRFIDKIQNRPNAGRIALIITADHPAPSLNQSPTMPLIIYGTDIPHTTIDVDASQLDIYPTILNLLGYKSLPYTGLGQSIFDRDSSATYTPQLQHISDLILDSDYFHPTP